jgi:putative transcriptional regulator
VIPKLSIFCKIKHNNCLHKKSLHLILPHKKYKINVLEALKSKGYTTYTLRKEKILSESTIQKLRVGEGVAWDNLETLCKLLECNIGDLLEYIKED